MSQTELEAEFWQAHDRIMIPKEDASSGNAGVAHRKPLDTSSAEFQRYVPRTIERRLANVIC